MTSVSATRSTAAASLSSAASSPTLREGSKGAAVTQLQNLLRNKGYNIAADGRLRPQDRGGC